MIYLIKSYLPLGKYIYKVGFTNNMVRRCYHYFYANPGFEIVSTREGDEILEKLLHYYLYYKGFQYKKNGKLDEWFLGNIEVRNIFHYSREKIEKELWKHREEIFNPGGSSTDYKIFEYLYQKNKEDFIGEEFIIDENKKIIRKSKEVDIIFWKIYSPDNLIIPPDINLGPFLEKEIDDFLDNHFYKTGIFKEKMKMYCEFMDKHQGSQEVSDSLYFRIKDDRYSKYYNFYGTSGCRAKSFKEALLRPGIEDSSEEGRLKAELCILFRPGEKYTLKELKLKLASIYSKLGISRVAKAKDLEKYFKIAKTKVKLSDGTIENGYKIL